MKPMFVALAIVSASLLSSHPIHAQAPAASACAPAAGLTFICGLQNPEDVVLVPGTRWLVTSGMAPGAGPLRFAQLKDFGPDNVRWTADNRLITAGLIDDEPACGGRPKDEKGIRCPMGYAVATIDPKTMTATEIARGPRTPSFTGTAMAAIVGNQLWLGSFLADRLAYRPLK